MLAGGIVILPNAPLGLITLGVQALAGLLLPSATVFLVLLCNDKDVLGPWVNRTWLNVVATVIVGVLVMLSLILAVETVFPSVDTTLLLGVLGGTLATALLLAGAAQLRPSRRQPQSETGAASRSTWRMPPVDTLPRPVSSLMRTVGLASMQAYLGVAALVLLIKVVGLALGH